ncbi:MAG: nicotinate (nicotinamide) nucleotide adenylyltransferase [Bacteroidales bacterium]|nr:nicotinate (nicotinamide) nucleotide adenylyltransferase [Bacteroidales bacterium]
MKIAVFSGSFDPPHAGHIAVATYILEKQLAEEVWFTPTPHNPLKEAQLLSSTQARMDMASLAIAPHPQIKLCEIETRLPQPSYTVNTLRTLRQQYPQHQFLLVIGADNWKNFHLWREAQNIIAEFHILVYPRKDYPIHIAANHSQVEAIQAPEIDISSTTIRKAVTHEKEIRRWLPKAVYEYILKNNLYQGNSQNNDTPAFPCLHKPAPLLQIPPQLHLANYPTRIDKLHSLSKELGKNIYIKRDDQTGSEVSGNKIRKLEFVFKDVLDKGCDTVITCGGIQSNHARATTATAVQLGLSTVLVLKVTENQPAVDGNYFINKLLGAAFHFISEEDYRQNRNSIMEELKNKLAQQGRKAYIIPEGASNGLGCFGYYKCFYEILEQEKQLGINFDAIVTAIGSGGTYGGLFMANKTTNSDKRIIGFNVADTAPEFQQRIYGELQEMLQISNASVLFTPEEIDIIDGYVGTGYAQSRQEELQFIAKIARANGTILDPVYTGKAMYGLYQEIKKGGFSQAKNILFMHTGGLMGLFPKREQFIF